HPGPPRLVYPCPTTPAGGRPAWVKAAATPESGANAAVGDRVHNQRHLCRGRRKSAAVNCYTAANGDCGSREDISFERRTVEGRLRADIPIQPDMCTVTYIFHDNCRGGR